MLTGAPQNRTRFALLVVALALLAWSAEPAPADEPHVSYIFPAGGQRGTTVEFRVGGHFLHGECPFEMTGPGVKAAPRIRETKTTWLEGPLVPKPASQRKQDYPRDHLGRVEIADDAPLGTRNWRVSTSQGVTPAMKFIVGEEPEVVEQEVPGSPIAQRVELPVTINGRIFPAEDVDIWTFEAKKGQPVRCEVRAARLGSPLDARLELLDPDGRPIKENLQTFGQDPLITFIAPRDGKYQLRIHDINFAGLQDFVYRLTITSSPHVDFLYPLGGRRGTKTQFILGGMALPQTSIDIELSGDELGAFPNGLTKRIAFANARSNPIWIELDDLPEHLEARSQNKQESPKFAAEPVTAPAVLNGRIESPGDVDTWQLQAKQGTSYQLDLRASRLGSPLDGVVVVRDAAGKQLAVGDNLPDGETDCTVSFKAPSDGLLHVEVRDRFASRGGERFAYRLRVVEGQAKPAFQMKLPSDALNVHRGEKKQLRLDVTRPAGFKQPIQLTVAGLPPGVKVTGIEKPLKRNRAQLTFEAEANAPLTVANVQIIGTAEVDGKQIRAVATFANPGGHSFRDPPADALSLAVAVPTPFKIYGKYRFNFSPRGTIFWRHYFIDRGGFDGPIEVRLADRQGRHLQGVEGAKIVVPTRETEFDYPIYLPPWMEVGRTSRTNVMGTAVIKDPDGSEHKVSYSSQQQNDQIIIRVETGVLDMRIVPRSVLAEPGGSAEVTVHLKRDTSVTSQVELTLQVPQHIQGVRAATVIVPADAENAVLRVAFDKQFGPLNMPLTVRATAKRGRDKVIAESKLEIVPR